MLYKINSLSLPCSITLYKTKDEESNMTAELSGRDNENLNMTYVGKDMKSAEYFKTHGTCCWELFKKKNFDGDNKVLKEGAPHRTKNEGFKIKSVRRVDC